jgi:hypothetical protein
VQDALQVLSFALVPTTAWHTPPFAVVHSMHAVVQALAQQAPSSEQNPLAHWLLPLQAVPWACLHAPAPLQVWPAWQSPYGSWFTGTG